MGKLSRQSMLKQRLDEALIGENVYASVDEDGNSVVVTLRSKSDTTNLTTFTGNIMECTMYVNGIVDLIKAKKRA